MSVERPDLPHRAAIFRRALSVVQGAYAVSEVSELPDAIRVDQCPGCGTANVLVTYARTQLREGTIQETPKAAKCANERCFYFDPSVG